MLARLMFTQGKIMKRLDESKDGKGRERNSKTRRKQFFSRIGNVNSIIAKTNNVHGVEKI